MAAWLGDVEGVTVKVLCEDERKKLWVLHPRNSSYQDIVVSKGEDENFQVASVEATWLNFE